MTLDLKPYPQYKDSGVPWLGNVPEHWEVSRLGQVFCERGETNTDGRITEVLSVMKDRGVIPYKDKGNVGNKKSEDITHYKVVRPDDIVMNSMNVIIGSVGLSKYTGCLSQVYYVLKRRSEKDNPHYLAAYFQTKPFQRSLVRIGNGILAHRMRIPMQLLKYEPFPLPPLDEQTAIVHYLDYVDRRIRRYIRAKQKLIKLLEEQKQAIIHQAVTRGLYPNVRLKPSGVEWLGDVPEHWKIKRFKFLSKINKGQVDPRQTPYKDFILIAPNHIERGTGRIFLEETANDQGADSGKYLVEKGQIIYSKIRPNLRKAAIAKTDCICSADMYAISPNDEILPEYFLMLLLSKPFTQYTVDYSLRVAMPKVNREAMGNGWLWYPDKEEQRAILKEIYSLDKPLNYLIDKASKEIDLLREYRTRLIADVVTGKLDVRAAAAQLPDDQEAQMDEDDEMQEDEAGLEMEDEAEGEYEE